MYFLLDYINYWFQEKKWTNLSVNSIVCTKEKINPIVLVLNLSEIIKNIFHLLDIYIYIYILKFEQTFKKL